MNTRRRKFTRIVKNKMKNHDLVYNKIKSSSKNINPC